MNGEPQAEANSGTDASGLPLKDHIKIQLATFVQDKCFLPSGDLSMSFKTRIRSGNMAIWIVCELMVWALSGGASFANEFPDVILHDAKIVTVNSGFEIAQAIALKGERIQAVGSNDDILKLAGPDTKQISLGGKTVLARSLGKNLLR